MNTRLTLYSFFGLLYSADSLEEVVGLDVGYTGGALHKRLHPKSAEDEKQYSAYLDEYVHRRRERAFLKNSSGHIPASSIHSPSLHGHSYHGRKVITPAMKEAAMNNSRSSKEGPVSNGAGSVKSSPGSERDFNDNEKSVLDGSRNSGVPSLTSVKEEV